MTERQNFLLELYREFGDKAQNALDFINNNDGENRIVSAENHKTCQIEAIYLLNNNDTIFNTKYYKIFNNCLMTICSLYI